MVFLRSLFAISFSNNLFLLMQGSCWKGLASSWAPLCAGRGSPAANRTADGSQTDMDTDLVRLLSVSSRMDEEMLACQLGASCHEP